MLAKALGENGKQGRIAGRVQRDPPSRSVRADRVPTLPDAAAGRLVDGCAPPAAASSPASAQAAADSAKTGRTPATSSARCKTADAGTVAADVIRRTRARASIDREVSKISTRCTTVILPARALRRRDRRPEIFAGGEIVAFLRAPRAACRVPRRSPCVMMTPATRRMLAAAGHPVVAFRVAAHPPRHQGQHTAQLHPVDCAGPSSAVCFSDSAASLGTTASLAGLRFASPSGCAARFYRHRHRLRRQPAMVSVGSKPIDVAVDMPRVRPLETISGLVRISTPTTLVGCPALSKSLRAPQASYSHQGSCHWREPGSAPRPSPQDNPASQRPNVQRNSL